MLAVAVLAMRHLLREYRLSDVLEEFRKLTGRQVGLASLAAIAGYSVLSCYDAIALRYLGKRVPTPRVLLASFVGYTFSHNFGFAPLTALPIRFRIYSPAGLTLADVSTLFAFTSLTYGIGALLIGGIAFLVEPISLPEFVHLPFRSLHPLGWTFIALLVGYLSLPMLRTRPLRFMGQELRVPTLRIAMFQVLISAADWMLASTVLYALLPDGQRPEYFIYLGTFVLAMSAGTISHVPGGLGVFDAIILFYLSPFMSPDQIIGSLLGYRVVYNLAPLLVALLLLGIQEVRRTHIRPRGGI